MILFDRVINVILKSSYDTDKKFPILTPRSGVKPDMSVSFSMLEAGGLAYNIQVEVTNISQDKSFNIYEWDLMDVEIGYKIKDDPTGVGLLVHTMECGIFNAYTTGPNPNGKTIFVGIVGSHMRDVFVRKPIYIVVNKPFVTVKELVTTIATVIGHKPSVPKNIDNYELAFIHEEGYSSGQIHYKAENGLALINWLQGIISRAGQARNEIWSVTTFNNELMVLGNTKIGKDEATVAVNVDAINSMTLTGNIVDVEAPYNPLIAPGTLVSINPQFYTAALPSSETEGYVSASRMLDFASEISGVNAKHSNLYRILSMEVKFSTRDANMMKFKAVGGQSAYTGASDNTDVSSSTSSERIAKAREDALSRINKYALVTEAQAMSQNAVEISNVGGNSILESNTALQIQFGVHTAPVKGELNKFLHMSSSFNIGGNTVTILNNDTTFASLASEYYKDKVAFKPITSTENNPNKAPMAPIPDSSGGFTTPSIPPEFFAPVIALATYAQYMLHGMDKSGFADVSKCITSSIPNGASVLVPDIPDDITTMATWSMAFDQYANLLMQDNNSGVSDADIINYRQIAYYMESP